MMSGWLCFCFLQDPFHNSSAHKLPSIARARPSLRGGFGVLFFCFGVFGVVFVCFFAFGLLVLFFVLHP